MTTDQELYGRRGRIVTDQDAKDITRVEELAYDLKIQDVMTRDVSTVSPEMPMRNVLDMLRKRRISGAPVLDNENLVGIISMEDLVRAMSMNDLNAPVAKYMTTNLITVFGFDSLIKALEKLIQVNVGRLPVLDENNKLVGMITKGDITRGILIAIQKDYQEEEVRRYRASHLFEDIKSDRTTLVMRYHIKKGDFINGGNASSNIKRALVRLGASPQIARRCGIAIYEAEMNLIIHTNNGGRIKVEIEPQKITMLVTDDGPGIENIENAMKPGYSTATNTVREMGFGAGMGLFNIKRIVDNMELTSAPGLGTRLWMSIIMEDDESLREADSSTDIQGETTQ
ncbi:MAG TPA: CBS domain-containing protein [Anaerolineales bacterium]|nr:CBS domain-containing protein [Anaerolineales bacterium]